VHEEGCTIAGGATACYCTGELCNGATTTTGTTFAVALITAVLVAKIM
jgi:hypothetical protein